MSKGVLTTHSNMLVSTTGINISVLTTHINMLVVTYSYWQPVLTLLGVDEWRGCAECVVHAKPLML